MIALDTNVIVRILTRDNETQYARVRSLTESQRVFVPETVVLETEWVLRDIYDFSPHDVCRALRSFFGLRNVVLADPGKIARALEWHKAGMDFADALHLANSAHLSTFKTFDKRFVKHAKGLSTCTVSEA